MPSSLTSKMKVMSKNNDLDLVTRLKSEDGSMICYETSSRKDRKDRSTP